MVLIGFLICACVSYHACLEMTLRESRITKVTDELCREGQYVVS